jgi:triacylglycerol lipase
MRTELALDGFHLDTAITLAHVSATAYAKSDQIQKWALASSFGHATVFDRGNVQGFFCMKDRIAVLAFRGTSNFGQWIRDARFYTKSHPWGMVHAGFRDGVIAVEPDLAALDGFVASAEHFWITGHSLGGALALIAAARYRMRGLNPKVYTYGQPRVGLGRFADRFALELPGRLHRLINQNDIGPRIPPGLLYRHTGTAKRIVRPGVLELLQTSRNEIPIAGGDPESDDFFLHRRELLELTMHDGLETASALAEANAGPTILETELPPLTEVEFLRVQGNLEAMGADPEHHLEGLSWFDDHSIRAYINLLTDIRSRG